MTTLVEIAQSLPNGFHDARVRTCDLDFVARTLTLNLDIWVAEDVADSLERERYRPARLRIVGLAFCQMEAPDATCGFDEPGPLVVDLCEPEAGHRLAEAISPKAFLSRFFVSKWNAFIHVAADSAELEWLDVC